MEAAPAAPSIDETSPAAGEERCVSLDEISDCAPRQDSQERRDVSSEDARGAVGGPKSPRWTADEDQRLSELVRAAPDRARVARPKRRYDPEEPCAICLEPLGDAPQLPGCSHRLHAACVLGPDSLASHAWAENLPLLRRGQQVVCPVCRKTSWIPPGFL